MSQKQLCIMMCLLCIVFVIFVLEVTVARVIVLDSSQEIFVGVASFIADISFNVSLLYLLLSRLYRMIHDLDEIFVKLLNESIEKSSESMNSSGINNKSNDGTVIDKDKNINKDENSNCNCDENVNIIDNENTKFKEYTNIYKELKYNQTTKDRNIDTDCHRDSDHDDMRICKLRIDERMEQNQTTQVEVVDMMTKISLLTIVTEIMWHSYGALLIYQNTKYYGLRETDYSHILNICINLVLSMLVCCDCFVLYFTFVFNQSQYFRCCGPCHKCLKSCVKWIVVKKNIQRRLLLHV